MEQRGIDQSQEQSTSKLIRDTRTLGQRVSDFLKNSSNVAGVLLFLAVTTLLVPGATDLICVLTIILILISKTRRFVLPFRMPKRIPCKDYNSPKPGGNEPGISNGIYFFGNDRKTNNEVWFTNDDMRTHALIFGSTGSGKTEALVSIAYNALVQGSGFIYVDGKGDNSLFAKVFSLVRYMGREDDILLINFMTGARDIIGPQERRLSNTMNPFARGSSSMLTQLVVSLMDSGGDKGGGDMWKGRAIAFVEALMKVLVAMRDAGHILIDANTIRNYFSLERLEAMVMDKLFMRDGQSPVSLEGVASIIMEPINNYVLNLPGYVKEKKGKQVSQVYEQHGYITMQLTRVFSSLADTYGHIIRTNLPEVDLKDVVLNRRILVVLLPALEKSPDELANLGKVIIASLKAMMASGLGDEVEGLYSQVIERKPTNARNPYLCILDEYGYYAVPGFAVVPAQARSLGFSVIFAGQDLPAFQKASKEEAASIGANTNIKVCMKLEDPMETWDFFMKSAGEAHVSVVSGYQSDAKSMTGTYMDSQNAQMEKRSRIDLLDLKEQREGESHIFFKSRIVRAKMFYANPRPVRELRLNQFVKVEVPAESMLQELVSNLEKLRKKLKESHKIFATLTQVSDNSIVKIIVESYANEKEGVPLVSEKSILFTCYSQGIGSERRSTQSQRLSADEIDLFSSPLMSDFLQEAISITDSDKDSDEFTQPLVSEQDLLDKFTTIMNHQGSSKINSSELAMNLIDNISSATLYPLETIERAATTEIARNIEEMLDNIVWL